MPIHLNNYPTYYAAECSANLVLVDTEVLANYDYIRSQNKAVYVPSSTAVLLIWDNY